MIRDRIVNRKKEQEASEKEAQVREADAKEADETRHDVSGQMKENDAADIALAAVDELADQAAEIENLKEALEAARSELEQTNDKLLRQAAEFQNYRRRSEDEKSSLVEFGKSIVIQQFLDVLDDLRRSLDAAKQAEEQQEGSPGPAYRALKDGVELVYKKFLDELKKHNVEPIEAVGRPFDENEHEAMMQRESEGEESGVVLEEMQKGYRMGDRVLRHSKVIVSS